MRPEVYDLPPDGTAMGNNCYMCNTRCGAPYVDTGMDIEFEGRLVIGAQCLAELAKLVGFAGPVYRKNLETQVKNLREKLEKLEPKANAFDMFYSHLQNLGTDVEVSAV